MKKIMGKKNSKNRIKKMGERDFVLGRARASVVFLSAGALTAFSFMILSVGLLTMTKSHAEVASTQAEVTVLSSCEMSSDTDTAHTAEVAPGIYRSGIGETTITTICNDANGYAIYANGYTNNEIGRNDMLGQSSGRTIATGTATSGDTSNWAMQLTAVDNSVAPTIATGYDAYHTIPDEYTKVVSFANSTMTNDAGSKFKVTFASFVSSAQVADTYLGRVRYTLIHPASSTETPCVGTYTINYDSNGGSGNMDSQTVCMDRNTIVLADGFTPPDANSQFFAWNTASDGSGYTYHPGQSVMNLANVNDSITLYAQWTPRYIQDLTASTCQLLTLENPYTVYDRRDGNDYTVRYIEGACWMTQNLRITGTVNAQYSNFSTYDNVDVCEEDQTVGGSSGSARCHDSDNTTNGVWYNYVAASANTVDLLDEDICPIGWRLPGYEEFNDLVNASGAYASTTSILFSPVVGGFYSGSSLSRTDRGYWWTSSRSYGTEMYILIYEGGSRISYTSIDRSVASYIRCVRI